MSGIQPATLGGVAWLLAYPEQAGLKTQSEPFLTFAVAGFVFTAMGLSLLRLGPFRNPLRSHACAWPADQ
jgi:hypothetical protein